MNPVEGDVEQRGSSGISATGLPSYKSSLLPIRFTNVRKRERDGGRGGVRRGRIDVVGGKGVWGPVPAGKGGSGRTIVGVLRRGLEGKTPVSPVHSRFVLSCTYVASFSSRRDETAWSCGQGGSFHLWSTTAGTALTHGRRMPFETCRNPPVLTGASNHELVVLTTVWCCLPGQGGP